MAQDHAAHVLKYISTGEKNTAAVRKIVVLVVNVTGIWNIVFTQFDSDGNGNYTPLEHPNIDTGMGLERLACILQWVDSLFDVDTVQNIMKHVGQIAGVKYGNNKKTDVSLRVITDHVRSITFMIGDGVMPSNEGRGYVVRRLLRRAARHMRLRFSL